MKKEAVKEVKKKVATKSVKKEVKIKAAKKPAEIKKVVAKKEKAVKLPVKKDLKAKTTEAPKKAAAKKTEVKVVVKKVEIKPIVKKAVEPKKEIASKPVIQKEKPKFKKEFKSKEMSIADLEEAMKTGQVFDALVKQVDSNLNLNVFFAYGIKGIIPREEVSSLTGENGLVEEKLCLGKEGKIIQVSIKEIKKKDGRVDVVVLSRRELELKVRKWMFMHLKDGMKLKGAVRGMTDYAAFIDVGGGVTGMLKIEDISHIRISKVSDKLKMGQRLEVMVKKFDRDTGKIELSIKEMAGTFKEKASKLKEGDLVDGIVRNREKNGIFIELANDLVGLAEHVSGVEYGQKVLVHIKKINMEKERIKLKIIG